MHFSLVFPKKKNSLIKHKGVCLKMSKTSNKTQVQHLVTLMEANPDIACGFHKGSKETLVRFWKNAEIELNSMGPPTKCVAEWKKVWADQKKYVRQKAAQNLNNKKRTGGGPNKEQTFSPTEEAIYQLIDMKSSVEGVPVKSVGLTDTSIIEGKLGSPENICCVDEQLNIAEGKENTTPDTVDTVDSSHKKYSVSQKDSLKSSYEALQAKLVIQRELLKTIKLIETNQQEQSQNIKRIYRSLDKLTDIQQKHFKEMEILKRKEIEELQRHNVFIENLRVVEDEFYLERVE